MQVLDMHLYLDVQDNFTVTNYKYSEKAKCCGT